MSQQQTILALHERGWSKRKIARELGLDRVTVRRCIAATPAKSPTPQIGSQEQEAAKSPAPHTGSLEAWEAKSPGVQTGSSGSLCARWQGQIEKALEAGLSVQRIYQDLV
ncbi:MAG: helix-turn-helix domain-containing protein, partial [Pseudomonadota bacterium]|nr:helix-turn-helix domain-containing protein [Pseudomonadota bacterium]